MTDADQKQEDDALQRMLATKSKPHKPIGKRRGEVRKLEKPVNESD